MKVKISRTIKREEEVDIDLPYYFEIATENSISYGKIEEERTTIIAVSRENRFTKIPEFRIEIHKFPAHSMSNYIKEKYEGTEEDYLKAKQDLLEAALNA